MTTLSDIVNSHDLKVGCTCGRIIVVDAEKALARFLAKGWSQDLADIHEHFRCTVCADGAVTVEPVLIHIEGEVSGARAVEAIFHGNRKHRKRRNEGGYGLDGGRRTMGRWWK